MSRESPFYAHLIALGFGIIAFTSIDWFTFDGIDLPNAAIYLSLGLIIGLLWPKGWWKWGLWLSVPIYFVIGFSVLFAGFENPSVFLQNDLPVLITVLLSSCLGSLVGSLLNNKLRGKQNSKVTLK